MLSVAMPAACGKLATAGVIVAMIRSRMLSFGSYGALHAEPPDEAPSLIEQIVYNVPIGYRAIVRDVRVWRQGATPPPLDLYAIVNQSGAMYPLLGIGRSGTQGTAIDGAVCDVVLEQGHGLVVHSEATAVTWWISGAELLLLPQG